MAWLQATPKPPEGAGNLAVKATEADKKRAKMSRLERAQHDKGDKEFFPAMPDCEAMYLVSYLFSAGPTVETGFGPGAIPESEVAAWQQNTGIELDYWEGRMMREMSKAYCKEAIAAQEHDAAPPWGPGADQLKASPMDTARKLKSLFRSR